MLSKLIKFMTTVGKIFYLLKNSEKPPKNPKKYCQLFLIVT
jgi:hypothetical protein